MSYYNNNIILLKVLRSGNTVTSVTNEVSRITKLQTDQTGSSSAMLSLLIDMMVSMKIRAKSE